MAWQLMKGKKALTEPGPLPENWGPICGLEGFREKLGDLSWLGDKYAGMGWVEIDDPQPAPPTEQEVKAMAKQLLSDTDWSMLPDVPMTVAEKQDWIEYRRRLRNIQLQPGYPENTAFPQQPK